MLIAFLLVLSAVKVSSEAVDQDGIRKSRQLEFGLQDIRTGDEETLTTVQLPSKDDFINEQLPPVSSSLSPEIISTQQVFDFKSANFDEKENNLCKSESCDFKDSSEGLPIVPKPSRDLVPPFNDLEQELANKGTTFFEQTNEEIKTTVDIQTTVTTTTEKPEIRVYKPHPTRNIPRFIKHTTTEKPEVKVYQPAPTRNIPRFVKHTTTEKPEVKVYQPAPTRNIPRFFKTTNRPKIVSSTAAATNEIRSYLPPQPEFSAAAQTNVAVVQPARQNNHEHDHHHHHHDENFNICDDAFHAFLCAPLKARKRITGAFPASLQGQSSYINYQKTLRNFDRETAPSNAIRNDYLPPNPSPTNLIQSSYLPPSTTRQPIISTTTTTIRPYSAPKVIPESSNTNDRFYLPPALDSPLPVRPQPSNTAFSTVTSTTQAPTSFTSSSKTTLVVSQNSLSQNVSPTVPSFNSLSSNENSFYLPPNPNPQPSASFVSTSQNIFPIISTISPISSTFVPLPSVTNFAPLPSNSIFVPQKPIVQPTFPVFTTFSTPSPIVEVKSYPTVSPAFPTVTPTFSTVTPTVPSGSSAFSSGSPAFSSGSPTFSSGSPTFSSGSPASSSGSPASSSGSPAFSSGSPAFSSASPAFSTILPTIQTTPKPIQPISSFAPQSSNPSGSYLPPVFQTTPRPVAPVSSFASQPSNPSGSYLPPVSEFRSTSKPSTTTLRPFSPSVKYSEQPSNADKAYLPPDPNEPAAAQISSAAVAAPGVQNPFHHGRDLCTDPFHSFLCASAKPRKRITGQLPSGFNPDSSNIDESRLRPESSNQDESRIRSEKPLEGSPAQNVGYKYPKPVNPFPTPSNAISSTLAPSTGYSYPKPDKIFPLPSQQDAKIASPYSTKRPEPILRPSDTKVVTGYDYPRPNNIFPLPAGQSNIKLTTTSAPTTGYSYPKPQKPFPLPSEQKEVRQKPKPKAIPSSTPSLSLPTNTVRGYQYPKPDQSLKIPDKKGYSYPKPDKRLELPTEGRSKFKLPQTSNSDPIGSLGSADFIPVNKVEFKRAESSKLLAGLRRFGERMKKRERDAQLYKRQLH